MQVLPTRPNLNTSVLKWKRVSGNCAGQPMVFSGARSERSVEDCVGPACRVLIDLMLDFSATGRARKRYCVDILWGRPK